MSTHPRSAVSRRKFIRQSALTAGGFLILPRHVLGRGFIAPSDKLNIAGIGVGGMIMGGNFLDYFVLDPDSVHGQHRGIFWVELGVALTVCGVMLKIFYMFAARGSVDDEGQS